MRKIVATIVFGFFLCIFSEAHAVLVTLDFEDLEGSGTVPADYAGLSWDANWNFFNGPYPPYTPSSGTSRIFTLNYGGWIDFGREVDFYGSWVSKGSRYADVYWEGYRDGVKIYESQHVSGIIDCWIRVDWKGVDFVRFVSQNYDYFSIDDIMYEDKLINMAPVAEAGDDQTVFESGITVQLDGTQSYDQEGDPVTYAWYFGEKPEGSTASLSDAASPMPTFVPDVYGIYIIDLVVSDPWQSSPPDSVAVSFDNIKPVASTGLNQSLIAGDTAYLDGSLSSDVNGDALTYQWSFFSMPEGSAASITGVNGVQASFIPDLPGMYVVSLVVNDGFLDSDPSTISITVISQQTAVLQNLQDSIDSINFWGRNAFKNKNMANTLTSKLNTVIQNVSQEQYTDALSHLRNDILQKTDGCTEQGAPDRNDWIMDCEAQAEIYPIILDAIGILNSMI